MTHHGGCDACPRGNGPDEPGVHLHPGEACGIEGSFCCRCARCPVDDDCCRDCEPEPGMVTTMNFVTGLRRIFHRIDGLDAHDPDEPCEVCKAQEPPGVPLLVTRVDPEAGTITLSTYPIEE